MYVARHPYVAAVILHGILFAVIGFYTIGSHATKSDADPPSAAPTASSPSANSGFTSESPPFATSQLEAKISSSLTLAERLTPEQRFSAAGDYASQLEALSSVTTMKEMGSYLGSTVNWKPKAGSFDPGKEKIFDHSSSMPIGAREVSPGKYVFVFRDANDNRFEHPAAPGDETAAKAFALLDRSDVLREFKTSVLLPMLNQKLDGKK